MNASKVAGKQKKKAKGLRVFWLPKARGHSHKKNKYYVSHREGSDSSIMSGDSPNSHRNEVFDFKEGRTSPTPTTSKDIAIQSSSGAVQHSVLVEPERDKDDDHIELSSPILNNSSNDGRRNSDPDKTIQLDELSYSGKKKHDKDRDEKKKLNGDFDKLDGVWVPSSDSKKPVEEDDDNCVVKCLYYTMQCCECAII